MTIYEDFLDFIYDGVLNNPFNFQQDKFKCANIIGPLNFRRDKKNIRFITNYFSKKSTHLSDDNLYTI